MKQIKKNIVAEIVWELFSFQSFEKHKELEWPRFHFYENEEAQLYSDAKAFTTVTDEMFKKETKMLLSKC